MIFILQRYIFRELFKVFVLATIALTLILSLGSTLRPIQEYGVGPAQVFHLLGYFIPITLTFVLPIAGLFAGALVYGRFASDNELDACRASGISMLTLITPGIARAIIIASANLILSFYVVPSFFHRAERALKADAKHILFRNIQRKGFYSLPPHGAQKIYAERADIKNNILEGVIVTEVKGGIITKTITAERAKIDFDLHQSERFNEVAISARNVYQIGGENEPFVHFERFTARREFSSLLSDDINFKKIGEIKEIYNDPLLFYPVKEVANKAFRQYAVELLCQDIKANISDVNDLYHFRGDPNCAITLTNIEIEEKEEAQLKFSGDVTIVQYDVQNKKEMKKWNCTEALLRIEGQDISDLTIVLELSSPKWENADGTEGISALKQYIRGLLIPDNIKAKLDSKNVLTTIDPDAVSASLGSIVSPKLAKTLTTLKIVISNVVIDIYAELNKRLVFGIGCVPLILIGLILGIKLQGGHILVAFGASVIPATLLIICILMGQEIAKKSTNDLMTGVSLMWAGVVILTIIALWLFKRLLKN
jgi:lipopolysaccharide export LptBFGC system permease protein LptF